jgi:hypothetical protein
MRPRVLIMMLVCSSAIAQVLQSKPTLQSTPMQQRLKTLVSTPSRTALADVLNGPSHPDGRPGYQRVALAATVLASEVQLMILVKRLGSLLKDKLQSIFPAPGQHVAHLFQAFLWVQEGEAFRGIHNALTFAKDSIKIAYWVALHMGVWSYASHRTSPPPLNTLTLSWTLPWERDPISNPKAIDPKAAVAVSGLAVLLCALLDSVPGTCASTCKHNELFWTLMLFCWSYVGIRIC